HPVRPQHGETSIERYQRHEIIIIEFDDLVFEQSSEDLRSRICRENEKRHFVDTHQGHPQSKPQGLKYVLPGLMRESDNQICSHDKPELLRRAERCDHPVRMDLLLDNLQTSRRAALRGVGQVVTTSFLQQLENFFVQHLAAGSTRQGPAE